MQLVHSGPSGGLSLNPLRAESGWWGVHRLVWPGREFLEEETVLKFMAVISGRISEEADGKKMCRSAEIYEALTFLPDVLETL